MLRANFLHQFKPSRENSIDEAMVGFKGRSSIKQYMPMKPTKGSYKVWCRCDAKTEYICDFHLYTGARGSPEQSLGTKVILQLAEPLFDRGYHLYFDNFFSSVTLAQTLLQRKTGMIVTARANRTNFPQEPKKANLM